VHKSPCILCHAGKGHAYEMADKMGWPILVAAENPTLPPGRPIVVICSNTGDEELQPEMEEYLLSLPSEPRLYALCELGNYFGFERNMFGCKKVARALLDRLGWTEVANVSIDALPEIDWGTANIWIAQLKKLWPK